MLKKTSFILMLALLATGCTREVYLQPVPCDDCQPCDDCKEPEVVKEVYEVVKPAPVCPCYTCTRNGYKYIQLYEYNRYHLIQHFQHSFHQI